MIKDIGQIKGPLMIFGGPYSNLAATRAIKQAADEKGLNADQVVCTGDLVAYCAEPEATVELIQNWGCHVVMGNCEESLAAGAPDCGCGFDKDSACSLLSVEWYRYADKHVPREQKQWMGQLPRQLRLEFAGKQFHVVHGSVNSINQFVFESSSLEQKEQQLLQANTDILIGGHCGIPFGQQLSNGYWLNAGVIGMPAHDSTPDGWYMMLEEAEQSVRVSWHRLVYPTEQTIEAMDAAQICRPYAECIATGIWPSVDVLPEAERAKTQPLNLSEMYL